MPLQSCEIGCAYKSPFCNFGHIAMFVHAYIWEILQICVATMFVEFTLQIRTCYHNMFGTINLARAPGLVCIIASTANSGS